MNPRRLHSDTIFSISGFSFGSAIRSGSFWQARGDVKEGAGTVGQEPLKKCARQIQFNGSPSPLIPLPLGEGNGWRALNGMRRHPASSDASLHVNRRMMPPLPAGEGRGEGELSAVVALSIN